MKDLELRQEYKRIAPEATAAEAIALMAEHRVPLLLVEKASPEDALGAVTRRDIIEKLIGEGVDPATVRVASIAAKPLLIVNNIDVDITWVACAMARHKVSCMAIFDEGEFKGFVTDRDLLRGVASGLRPEGEGQRAGGRAP